MIFKITIILTVMKSQAVMFLNQIQHQIQIQVEVEAVLVNHQQ